jgi:hypothetical protein
MNNEQTNKQTNFWDLYELAKEVLTDIELIDNEEFHDQTLSVYTSSKDLDPILQIHLTKKGFDMFMEHVRARSEQIGEEVREPVEVPLSTYPDTLKVTWLGVPGLEFFTLREVPK